jgi:hypothetical protein
MKILVSGCSFTVGWAEPRANWPSRIHRSNIVKNLACAGAGNRYIGQSVVLELLQDREHYDLVLVMWSGLQRVDFLVNDFVYDAIDTNRASVDGLYCYAFFGDSYTHKHNQSLLRDTGKEIFKLSNEETLGCASLIEMINLQNFLKANSIPYRFMSYVNYWDDDDQVINLNFGVHKYLSCSQLAKHLDFDNFLFYNDSHDGFYEFAKDKNMIADDGFHPTLQAHIEWADFIREKL